MATGISEQGMRKLSYDFLDYYEEFKKIKSSLDNIESRLKTTLVGDIGNSYIKSLNDFNKNITYVSESMKIYSEFFLETIKKYEYQDSLSFTERF